MSESRRPATATTTSDTEANKQRSASILNASDSQRRRSSTPHHFGGNGNNRCMIATIVYLALFLDNVLLTVVVPILPDYLATINNNKTFYTRMNVRRSTNSEGNLIRNSMHGSPILANIASSQQQQQQFSYRNLPDGSIAIHSQTHQTKHPIPGKSMVNFSLVQHLTDDKFLIPPILATAEQKQQQQQQQQQQQHTRQLTVNNNNISSNSNGIDINKNSKAIDSNKKLSPSTSSSPSPSSSLDTSFLENMNKVMAKDFDVEALAAENGSIGFLLAMKAFIQLIFNPIVGNLSSKFGYRLPIIVGTFCLLMSSLVFAVGETFFTLLLARAIQGIGSACIGVCGMSLVAQHYPEEDKRSKVMGIILGSIALGVLFGYPFGGFLYDWVSKSAPFIILSTMIFLNLGLQLIVMDLSVQPEVMVDVDQKDPKWKPLLESKMILAIIVAIWFSTSSMAILEPCLPIWLIQNLKPTKWQLGTVFIPDSIGYFVGTNFFGSIAYKSGQVKISCLSLLLVGISSILIPSATSVGQLLLPHFCLGLGIGIIDSALVPLLATFVDATLMQEEQGDMTGGSTYPMSSYGTVYCLQQTSVSLAYCLAPLIGGELAEGIGFTWLMRIVGIFNIVYGPILVYLYQKYDPKALREKHNEILLANTGRGSQYRQLYNSMDAE